MYGKYVPKNKPLTVVLGQNVAELMKAKKLTQTKVAAMAAKHGTEIDQTSVSRVKNAVYPATVDTIEAIANGIGVEPWRLFVPATMDEKFLAILQAWSVTSEVGRDLMRSAASVAVERYSTERERDASK